MKKINVLWIILNLIFLIVFNTIFFVSGGIKHNASIWVSYAFIHSAYLMLLLTPKLIRTGKSSAEFGFSLYSISAAYFLIEFVTGIVFILFYSENHKVVFLVQFCIAGLYTIMLVSYLIANEHTANTEEKRQHQIEYVKNVSTRMKELLEKISDKEAKKKVERIYDAIYSSPVKSHPNLIQIEQRILTSIDELEDVVSTGNNESIISSANTLLSTVNERNIRLMNFH